MLEQSFRNALFQSLRGHGSRRPNWDREPDYDAEEVTGEIFSGQDDLSTVERGME